MGGKWITVNAPVEVIPSLKTLIAFETSKRGMSADIPRSVSSIFSSAAARIVQSAVTVHACGGAACDISDGTALCALRDILQTYGAVRRAILF